MISLKLKLFAFEVRHRTPKTILTSHGNLKCNFKKNWAQPITKLHSDQLSYRGYQVEGCQSVSTKTIDMKLPQVY